MKRIFGKQKGKEGKKERAVDDLDESPMEMEKEREDEPLRRTKTNTVVYGSCARETERKYERRRERKDVEETS